MRSTHGGGWRTAALAGAALLSGCSSGGSKTDGGTTGGTTASTGSSAGGSTGGSGGLPDAGTTTYCDGVELQNGGGAGVYLVLYPLALDVQDGCSSLVTAVDGGVTFASTGTFSQLGGVWDAYAYSSTEPFNGLYPGGCDDLGIGSGPDGGVFVAPDGGSTVAEAVASAKISGADGGSFSFYGVVTYVSPWSNSTSGSLYLQDPVPSGSQPAPYSGINLYITSGGGNLPAIVPSRGDVVLLHAVLWSPYKGINEFELDYGSTLTTIGRSPLPPPVAVTASQLAATSTELDQWKGMRVVDVESFTIQSNCPAAMQYSTAD